MSNPYPKDITLISLNLQNDDSWLKSDSQTNSDLIYFWNGAGWVAYYYNTDDVCWKRTGSSASQDNTVIPAGSGVWFARKSQPSAESSYVNVGIPFTLTP